RPKPRAKELKVGDIVLIELENKKRVMWLWRQERKKSTAVEMVHQGSTNLRTSSGFCLT
ncbi:hypothetical protein CEXT_777341, partial [Caerostris extrusa]